MTNNKKPLSFLSIILITVVSVDSIRNLPATAIFGGQIFFFFLGACILFLLPCAFISAELSAHESSSNEGGIYYWLKEAFGDQVAFIGIWFQWLENVIFYPAILSFVAGTLAYIISPSNALELSANKNYILIVILSIFWLLTLINLYGIKLTARISNLCTIFGLLLPMSIIILLGLDWIISGNNIQIPLSISSLWPDFTNQNLWVSLTGIILSFSGIEIATVYVRDIEKPKQKFPKAIIISTFIIASTLLLGSLSIAVSVPTAEINLIAGIMQALEIFLHKHNMITFLPIMGIMVVLGAIGCVLNWIIAPTTGLHMAAMDGLMPKVFKLENKYKAPYPLLLLQAILTSLLTAVYLLLPSINGAYWLLTVLASQIYMLMYLMMFAAAIKLRKTYKNTDKNFTIGKHHYSTYIVASIGVLGCLITIVSGFIPPESMNIGSVLNYEALLFSGLIILSLPPFIINKINNKIKN
ncbi:MAG: amino acid permease [Gammaproteobacteria bacterium]|nr:amino acid permease [Gammaproteobacteria bacterium]